MNIGEFTENTWEWACARVIIGSQLDMPVESRNEFRDLYESGMFTTLARNAWSELVDLGEEWSADNQVALMARKQADYGHQNILKFGRKGVEVRLWDKIARYENLIRRGVEPENESLHDTLIDIVGYCIIWQMLSAGTFKLPLKADL